jgi:muramoyltetrapeptide carboxypeptidase
VSTSSRTIIRPKALPKGARLAVLSPASTPRRELVELGLLRLQQMGYHPVLSSHALDTGPLYYAGSIEHRVNDFHEAFRDPRIDGIVCTRGGWGSAELLPHLDAALIRVHPKPFIGYSDHTSLHVWLRNEANLATFYGPMIASDFSREHGVHEASWASSLHMHNAWSLGMAEGLRVLRPGHAAGTLYGGCLSIYTESLGTLYAARAGGGILFLEDVGTKPYQWDRMLLHMRYAGLLDEVQGIVFGDMRQCVSSEEDAFLERAILHALRDFEGPIAIGLRSGHVDAPNVTLPLGAEVQLDLRDGGNPRMDFVEVEPTV